METEIIVFTIKAVREKQGQKGPYNVVETDKGDFNCFDFKTIEELKAWIGSSVRAELKINGKFRHINKVLDTNVSVAEKGSSPITSPASDKNQSIIRMSSIKSAVDLYNMNPDKNLVDVLKAAEEFEKWIMRN